MCKTNKARLLKKTKEELASIIIEKDNALSASKKSVKDWETKTQKYLTDYKLSLSMLDARDKTLKLERSNKIFYIKLLIASLILNGVLLVISLL